MRSMAGAAAVASGALQRLVHVGGCSQTALYQCRGSEGWQARLRAGSERWGEDAWVAGACSCGCRQAVASLVVWQGPLQTPRKPAPITKQKHARAPSHPAERKCRVDFATCPPNSTVGAFDTCAPVDAEALASTPNPEGSNVTYHSCECLEGGWWYMYPSVASTGPVNKTIFGCANPDGDPLVGGGDASAHSAAAAAADGGGVDRGGGGGGELYGVQQPAFRNCLLSGCCLSLPLLHLPRHARPHDADSGVHVGAH